MAVIAAARYSCSLCHSQTIAAARILEKILDGQIIVFATPIWGGNQSSLMQRAIERLDELHNELLETGRSRLTNKVGGIVITGEEDGEQHITGNISNFFRTWACSFPRTAPFLIRGRTRVLHAN